MCGARSFIGKVSRVQVQRVSNRNSKQISKHKLKAPTRKHELQDEEERDAVSMEQQDSQQHGGIQSQVYHGNSRVVVRTTTGDGHTPRRKSQSNKPRKILTQDSLIMSVSPGLCSHSFQFVLFH